MNKIKTFSISIILIAFFTAVFTSCYTPSPLYGSWADNSGNKISFINDGTFVAKIYNSEGTGVTYEGDYQVIDNVLVFSVKTPSYSVTTEWDIRGSIFYCTWINENGEVMNLTLYHTSK